jgi:hypothetical protein
MIIKGKLWLQSLSNEVVIAAVSCNNTVASHSRSRTDAISSASVASSIIGLVGKRNLEAELGLEISDLFLEIDDLLGQVFLVLSLLGKLLDQVLELIDLVSELLVVGLEIVNDDVLLSSLLLVFISFVIQGIDHLVEVEELKGVGFSLGDFLFNGRSESADFSFKISDGVIVPGDLISDRSNSGILFLNHGLLVSDSLSEVTSSVAVSDQFFNSLVEVVNNLIGLVHSDLDISIGLLDKNKLFLQGSVFIADIAQIGDSLFEVIEDQVAVSSLLSESIKLILAVVESVGSEDLSPVLNLSLEISVLHLGVTDLGKKISLVASELSVLILKLSQDLQVLGIIALARSPVPSAAVAASPAAVGRIFNLDDGAAGNGGVAVGDFNSEVHCE